VRRAAGRIGRNGIEVDLSAQIDAKRGRTRVGVDCSAIGTLVVVDTEVVRAQHTAEEVGRLGAEIDAAAVVLGMVIVDLRTLIEFDRWRSGCAVDENSAAADRAIVVDARLADCSRASRCRRARAEISMPPP
jgi:hypothetical protein